MRTQISNKNLNSYRLFIVVIFLCIFAGHAVLPMKFENSGIVLIILFPFFYYIFIGRFCKIEIDSANLYYVWFQKRDKVALNKVISVKIDAMPNTFFFKTAYGITVRYFNDQGKLKKLKFLSPETHWGGDPSQIPEIKYLKSKIGQ
jgi:hypothetical protein